MRLHRKRNHKTAATVFLAGIAVGILLMYCLDRARRGAATTKHAGRAQADEILAQRVRSKIEESPAHTERVAVSVRGGWITLSGPVLAEEFGSLVSSVRSVRGVRGVENLLEIHEREESP